MRAPRTALAAAAAYLLLTIAMTWPLARGLARDVPGDLGDPLLVMWILAWGAEQLRAIGGGDFARIGTFFDANIFHPAPLALAHSEHLFAQVLQIFPVYLATGNPILAYNLLFISTFVVSGLGTFLLVRSITGSAGGAFAAGLLFAFALYRWPHVSHLQVLSAQWMPLTLYGFHRYFTTGHRRALAGAGVALALQNLSSGYYLLYFAPMVAMFVAWEMSVAGAWRSRRHWIDLSVVLLLVALITLPFVLPYKRVRDTTNAGRQISEVVRYSADVYSYFTAAPRSRAWGGTVQAHPKPEGELFPGALPLLLAMAALLALASDVARLPATDAPRVPRWVLRTALAAAALYAAAAAAAIFYRRLDIDLVLFSIRATNVTRMILPPLAIAGALLWLSPAARTRAAFAARRPEAIFAAIVVIAWWLSLGPLPRVLGRPLELWAPYRLLYEYVPGFEGVRVPARFAMMVALGLSVLAGLAIARLDRARVGTGAMALVCLLFLVESNVQPLSMNAVAPVSGFATPEARVYRPARAPAIYRELAKTPPDTVVLELPFGQPDYDVRAVYYSTAHWRRLVNGYSGFFPPHYARLIAMVAAGARGDELAWDVIRGFGITHVVVHGGAYLDDEGSRFVAWLQQHGAAEVFRDGSDRLLVLPP